MEYLEKKINKLSVCIDILQATTQFYEQMESAEAEELISLNKMIVISLREVANELISTILNTKETKTTK